ncbi:MAG: acyltransferase family protein [Limisphaerales bacterium]
MSSPSQRRFCWLDWFRFLAAFEVMAYHARGHVWVHYAQMEATSKSWLTWSFFVMTHWGGEAVVLFFVLSGFLVGGKVLERSLDRSFDLGAYARDRVSRIYVPFVPALVVSGIIGYLAGLQPISVSSFLGNLAGLQAVCARAYGSNLPLWTLAYEIWFYVLGGCLGVLVCRKGQARAIALCGAMFVFALFTRLQASLLFCWLLGAAGYLLLLAEDVSALVFGGGVALAVFGLVFCEYISAHHNSFGNFLASGRVAELIFSLGLAIVFPYLAKRAPVSKPVLGFERFGGRLASFSYTLYLTHYPLLSLWTKYRPQKFAALDAHSFSWFIIECVSCLLFAFVLYLPFEAQTARVRNWLKPKIPAGERAIGRPARLADNLARDQEPNA